MTNSKGSCTGGIAESARQGSNVMARLGVELWQGKGSGLIGRFWPGENPRQQGSDWQEGDDDFSNEGMFLLELWPAASRGQTGGAR